MRSSPKSTLLFWFKFACCCVAKHRELNNAFHIALSRRAGNLTAHKHCVYLKGDFHSAATPASLIQFSSWNYRVVCFTRTQTDIHAPLKANATRYCFSDFPRVRINVKNKSQLSLKSTTAPKYLLATGQKSWFLISCRARHSWSVRPRSLHRSVTSRSTEISLWLVS